MTGSTVTELLARAGDILMHAGIPDPRREAYSIWAGLLDMEPSQVWSSRGSTAPAPAANRFREAVDRRARGEPLAYVTGRAGFRYLDLYVDSRVLIPRPETEGLVDRVLEWGKSRSTSGSGWGVAVDVGTGSGCLAISLALECRFRCVIAIDVSLPALEVARRNLRGTVTQASCVFLRGTGLASIEPHSVDAIVSNPPYLSQSEYEVLEPSVRDFEPGEALVSGAEGMAHTASLLQEAREVLSLGGLLAIEVDCTRADRALGLAREAGWENARIEDDLFGYPRYLLATKES